MNISGVIREIKCEINRIHTGPYKVNDDWACIIIRGDEALAMAADLEYVKNISDSTVIKRILNKHIKLLESCWEKPNV